MARRRVATLLAAIVASASLIGLGPPVARAQLMPPGGLPTCLPAGTALPPGLPLPTGSGVPTCPSTSGSATLETLVQQFLADGALPAGLSAQKLAALLQAAAAGQLPAPLATVATALRQLAGSALNGPVAAEIACIMQSPPTSTPAFSDVPPQSGEASAIAALSATGMLSQVLPADPNGGFGPNQAVTQQQWLALLLEGIGVLSPDSGAGAPPATSAVLQMAQAAGLIPASAASSSGATPVNLADATAQLVQATGLTSLAQQMAGGSAASPSASAGATGAIPLTRALGLLHGIGDSPGQTLTRADAAALVARTLSLFAETVQALHLPTITAVKPMPLAPGLSVTLSGRNLGAAPGTVTWQPNGAAAESWTVASWSTNQVTVVVPPNATTGSGTLQVRTASGEVASAAAQVVAPTARLVKTLPDGSVLLTLNGQPFYTDPSTAAAILAMSPARQLRLFHDSAQALKHVGAASPAPADALRVNTVPAATTANVASTAASGACADGCVTLYGPGSTPYSAALSSGQVAYDVPCVKVLGYRVCSGWADAQVDLGGTVNGAGSPNGYFTELGEAMSGASLISSARMDATLGLTYTPKQAGDLVVIRARVITTQVDGGVGVAGAGVAPVRVYATANGFGTQEATVASRFGTLGASVASWPDLSVADLAEESLSKLDAINDTAQTLWQLYGLPGEAGTNHVSTFAWSGIAQAGQAFQVSLDTQAVAAANGLSQMEVNAVSGVVLVKVIEYNPTASQTGGGVCVNPSGESGPLSIQAVTPAAATPGSQITIQGSGFGVNGGTVALYTPALGILTDLHIDQWSANRIIAEVSQAPPGPSQLFVLPSPYTCSPATPAAFYLLKPRVSAIRFVGSGRAGPIPAPAVVVSGQGFGSVPPAPTGAVAMPNGEGGLLSLVSETVQLRLNAPAFPQEAPPAVIDLTSQLVPQAWSNTGFAIPVSDVPPGTYDLVLTRIFSNGPQGGPLAWSAAGGFVWPSQWSGLNQQTVVQDLGTVTLPGTWLQQLTLPGSGNPIIPGGAVVVQGEGFGTVPGRVVLVKEPQALVTPNGGWMPDAALALDPTYTVAARYINGWSDQQVAFTVPPNVAPGTYALWVLAADEGPSGEVPGPLPLTVAAPCSSSAAMPAPGGSG